VAIERVSAYLDGFNIYNGMMAKGWGHYRWLDYRALLHRYMRPPQELGPVKYFTSRMTHQPEKHARQALYIRALQVRGGIEIIDGTWTMKPVKCTKCKRYFKVPQEKRTDVNLATHLVADAFDDRFDTFVLVTADSDLIPAISYVKERFGKRFMLVDPPRRHDGTLRALADLHLHSRKDFYRQSQLPDPVEYRTRRGRTKRIHRPPSWSRTLRSADPMSIEAGNSYCVTCRLPVSDNGPTPVAAG
jgi:hypothetical protein